MIDWKIVEMSVPLLLEGTWVTLYVSFFAGIIGTVAGIVIGLLSLSNIKPIEWVIRIYVDFVRGTPLLIQIFLVFFALPVVGITMNEIWAGITALAFNLAGYAAEIVRGGVGAVEKGQTEAARSIGMTRGKILVYILLPQAARQMVPPFTNEMITMIKSFVAALGDLRLRADAVGTGHHLGPLRALRDLRPAGALLLGDDHDALLADAPAGSPAAGMVMP